MKFLIVVTLVAGASILFLIPCRNILFPNQDEDIVLEKMMLFWCTSIFVPGGIFVFLLPIWGLKQRQAKPDKMILDISNFEEMKLYVTEKLLYNKYEVYEQKIISEDEEYIFFIKDIGRNIECFLLTNAKFYSEESSQIIIDKANEIYTKCFKNTFSKRSFSGYTLVCVERVDNEFYKYLSTLNESVPHQRFYYSGYTFGGKILYLPIYKDSFASSELKKMRFFLKSVFEKRQSGGNHRQSGDG